SQSSPTTAQTLFKLSLIVGSEGRPISSAKVILINIGSSVVRDSRRTGSGGFYAGELDPSGDYTVSVVADAFEPVNYFLVASDSGEVQVSENFTDWSPLENLELKRVDSRPNLAREVPNLWSTAEAMQRTSFDARVMQALPLGSLRSVDHLAL